MSSKPFRLGLQIVEKLEPEENHVVLRTHNRDEMIRIIMRTREQLTTRDVILVTEIGFRPDYPVPVPAWFAEVEIKIDMPDEQKREHMRSLKRRVYQGKREGRIIV